MSTHYLVSKRFLPEEQGIYACFFRQQIGARVYFEPLYY